MGCAADQLELIRIRLPVDQDQIRLNVTMPTIFPLAAARVIALPRFQQQIRQQRCEYSAQVDVERGAAPTVLLALVVTAVELPRVIKRPH